MAAETFSNEGLDQILGIVPKAGSVISTLYMGLFTSQTATTVPAQTAVLSTYTGVAELPIGTNGYNRIALAAATWGALGAGTSGRKSTYPQVTFTCATAAWAAVNGFFICTASAHGSEFGIFYANFADNTAVTAQVGDQILITATWEFTP